MKYIDETYQGFKNWDTWNCNLWITNSEYSYNLAMDCQDSKELKRFWQSNYEGTDKIKTNQVDFEEIWIGLRN